MGRNPNLMQVLRWDIRAELPASRQWSARELPFALATAASASLMRPDARTLDFVRARWHDKLAPYEDGCFDPYYDGLLYLVSLLHLSGKYQVIKPQAHEAWFSIPTLQCLR